MKNKSIAVIGCGPAGAAAAIQLIRSGQEPVIFEKKHIGGLLKNAGFVENYPGFPDGISGAHLCQKIESQLRKLNAHIEYSEVKKIIPCLKGIKIVLDEHERYFDRVIVASGTIPEKTGIKIDKNASKMVLYEPFTIFKKTGKNIGIIGAGDAAYDYALSLSAGNKVTILRRGESSRCLDLLEKRCADKKIDVISNINAEQIVQNNRQLQLICRQNDISVIMDFDYIVIAAGRNANDDFVHMPGSRASENRIIFAGDVQNGLYRQTGIAIGDGLRAAMKMCEG